MRRAEFRPAELFGALTTGDVEFIVIGGFAADAHGVVWATFDVDVVVSSTEENLARLLLVLHGLRAEFNTMHNPPLLPTPDRLRDTTGPMLFRTSFGRLDVLKEAGGETYETLGEGAVTLKLLGVVVRVASLPALIRMKRAANRPKDQAAIIALEAALARGSE